MSEFITVSVHEAQIRTIPGRPGKFINEYADYIQQLSSGQAGKLTIGAEEKHTSVRQRLTTAAKAMKITLIIKRSGNDLYFWRGDGEAERPRRGRRPRTGRPGSVFPPTTGFSAPETGEQEEESTPLDQAFVARE